MLTIDFNQPIPAPRIISILDDFTIEPEFDAAYEELDRQFQELRLTYSYEA